MLPCAAASEGNSDWDCSEVIALPYRESVAAIEPLPSMPGRQEQLHSVHRLRHCYRQDSGSNGRPQPLASAMMGQLSRLHHYWTRWSCPKSYHCSSPEHQQVKVVMSACMARIMSRGVACEEGSAVSERGSAPR